MTCKKSYIYIYIYNVYICIYIRPRPRPGRGGRGVRRGCVRIVKIAFLYIMKHVKILSYKVTLLHFMFDIYIYIYIYI